MRVRSSQGESSVRSVRSVGRAATALTAGVVLVLGGGLGTASVMVAGASAGASPVVSGPDSVTAQEPVVNEARLAEVEAYLERERRSLGVPGFAAALVVGDDAVLEVGLGTADEQGNPVAPTTPFLIASLAKSVTAIAVLRLVDDGLVGLDKPVTTYVPELAPGGDSVTVADLLHHRAGPTTSDGLESFGGDVGASVELNALRLADRLQPSDFTYTNAGYDVLALLVERVSGRGFEDHLQDEVLGPLGMTATTTDAGLAAGAGLATGHYRWLGLGYRPVETPLPAGMVGSYRMFSTAQDLGRLLAAHLVAHPILTESSWRWLHEGRPVAAGDRGDSGDSGVRYGGGLFLFPADESAGPSLKGQLVLSHDGSALGFRAMQWLLPEEDTGFVLLANGNDQADEYQLVRVAYNVQRLLFGAPLVERTAEVDPLLRWGKQALVLLVVVQLTLGAMAWWALRHRRAGVGGTRSGRVVLAVAAVVDVVALGLVLVLLPRLLEMPLRVVLEAPDVRLLVALVVLGALSGVVRAVVWGLGVRAPAPAGAPGPPQAQPGSSTPPGTSASAS